MRHFLQILDIRRNEILSIFQRTAYFKSNRQSLPLLKNKSFILLFEKASTRTRISFELAIQELGGISLFINPQDTQLARGEPLKDTARVLNRYAHGLIIRNDSQQRLYELSQYSQIPIINALSDKLHPCQVMSDLFTIYERTPNFADLKIAWIGDGNNMAHSWINAAAILPFNLCLATPAGHEPDKMVVDRARGMGARVSLTHDPWKAIDSSAYINTDVWISMGGEEKHKDKLLEDFKDFQINAELLSGAPSEAKVMHCLPACREREISAEILEGPKSIVWDQAENRLHTQKALLEWIIYNS